MFVNLPPRALSAYGSESTTRPHSGVNPLGHLLSPRSIAIAGLSADPTKHGRRVLDNLRRLGYVGDVWGVNPNRPVVDDVEVFATFDQLPGVADVVVSAVPAAHVPTVARDAAACGSATMIVFAGGFAETGDAGRSLQDELGEIVERTGLRVLGPNSGGVIVPGAALAASFLTCLDRPTEEIRSGVVGVVTQSGGMGSYLHNLAAAAGGGLAASISTGNEVDIGLADGIVALSALDEVRSIAVVLETVRDGPAFVAAVNAAHGLGKRVVVCRVGTSERGQRLMRTHTGALARPTRVLDGVLDSLDVATAATPAELLDVAELVALTAPPAGPKVGLVTHSGGVGILLSDLVAGTDVELPAPSEDLRVTLEPLLHQGAVDNPLDMGGIIGGPHRFAQVVDAVARSGDVDLVVAVSSAHPPAHTAERVESLVALPSRVPVVHLWMAGDLGDRGLDALRAAGRPVTTEPRAAMRAVAALASTSTRPSVSTAVAVTEPTERLEAPLTEFAAKAALRSWGIPVVDGELASDGPAAAAAADRLGYPVVVKVSSPDLVHKTDIGGVVTNVVDRAQLLGAVASVTGQAREAGLDLHIDGVLVERHVDGPEVIVGALRDPTFGPMVLVGLGGVVANALDDARLALAPVEAVHARRMIESLAGIDLLREPRRGSAADLAALAQIVAAVGAAIVSDQSISGVDINPLVWADGWLALDATITIG